MRCSETVEAVVEDDVKSVGGESGRLGLLN